MTKNHAAFMWKASVALATLAAANAAKAQDANDVQPNAEVETGREPQTDSEQNTIFVTGSRFGGRTSIQSATPVDSQLQQSGRVDLIQQLKVEVPSFIRHGHWDRASATIWCHRRCVGWDQAKCWSW